MLQRPRQAASTDIPRPFYSRAGLQNTATKLETIRILPNAIFKRNLTLSSAVQGFKYCNGPSHTTFIVRNSNLYQPCRASNTTTSINMAFGSRFRNLLSVVQGFKYCNKANNIAHHQQLCATFIRCAGLQIL